MSDDAQAAQVAAPEVVDGAQEAPESDATVNTGQIEDQPAEGSDQQPESSDEVSPSKARRERRKAELDRLRGEATAKDAEIAELNEKLADYERRGQDPAPQEADYEDPIEYQAALSAYLAGRAFDDRDKARLQGEADARGREVEALRQQEQQEMAQSWAAQVADAEQKYADFAQVVGAPDLQITQSMAQLIAASDVGADVAYHLGSNKAEAARIAALPPMEQAMAIGRLEAAAAMPKANIETNAPAPIKPVKGAGLGQKDPSAMTPSEFRKWRESGGTM